MPSPVDLIRQRRLRRDLRASSALRKSRRGAITILSVFSVLIGIAAIGLAVLYSSLTRDLPSLDRLPVLLNPENGLLTAPTIIVDKTEQITIAELGAPVDGAAYLSISSNNLQEVSPVFLDAIIAAADPGYLNHPGFYRETLLSGQRDTIPLKLVSDMLFWQEPEGARRFVREGLLAAQIVSTYGRDQVLEWYINSAHFGSEAFGADSAARLYFGKSASRLTLAEAATLAAVSEAPDLNPFDTPDLALSRRDQTLGQMFGQGVITQDEVVAAMTNPLGVRHAPETVLDENAAFVNFVRTQVERTIPSNVLARGGLIIISTLDLELQHELSCTIETQMTRLMEGQGDLPENCEAARLLPSLPGENIPGTDTSAEGVVLDPLTGQVLAFVASDASAGPLTSAGLHPPGTILTPYIYLTSLARGLNPASLVWDIPAYLPPGTIGSPNLDDEVHGPMRIRTALAGDYLVPAANLLDQFGAGNVWNTAALSGLPSLAGETESLIFEGGALSLVEISHAYSALSTQGVVIGYVDEDSLIDPVPLNPTAVIRVEDANGQTWIDDGPPQARPVMSAPLAYALTHILSDETARWPALGHPNVLEVGRPVGVKMGFNQDQSSVWTVGFTPQLTLGIWVGRSGGETALTEEDPQPSSVYDPRSAAGIWHAMLKYAAQDLPQAGWSVPQGIMELDVCEPSGLLPTVDCPVVVREIFLQGNEPAQLDTLFRKFEVNRETGLLATVFTPASLIEERVYFVPPSEALSWAQQSGLNIPPEAYDLVSQPPAPDPDTRLDLPEMFSYVNGQVQIIGSASSTDFESYSVQVGQGLNPQQWLQIGDVSDEPVNGDELVVWDTAGLNGLYAIRLLVLRENNLVDTHIIQVTVDNQPPELAILYPADGSQFVYPQESTITMQIAASDNLLLERVDVLLDGRMVNSLIQPPYALSLDLLPGEHVLRAEATDQAGNITFVEHLIIIER